MTQHESIIKRLKQGWTTPLDARWILVLYGIFSIVLIDSLAMLENLAILRAWNISTSPP